MYVWTDEVLAFTKLKANVTKYLIKIAFHIHRKILTSTFTTSKAKYNNAALQKLCTLLGVIFSLIENQQK